MPIYTIRTLAYTGYSANRVDIVFMGDGYTSSEIDTTYHWHATEFLDYLFDGSSLTEPFGRYRNFFNAYAIEVVSPESGADDPSRGIVRNTALGASYRWDGHTDWLLYVDEAAARAVESAALLGTSIGAEMRFIVVNDTSYGGGAAYYAAYSAGNVAAKEIALHEVAHSFAGLADEYGGPGTYVGPDLPHPNVTTDPSGETWSRWIGYEQPDLGVIGAYEGAYYRDSGVYRPSLDSKMRSLNRPFDAVAREQFILAFYALVDPVDSHTPNATVRRNPAALSVNVVDPTVILVDWTVGSRTFKDRGETLRFDFDNFGFGTYTVSARAYDPTEWVRSDRSSLEQVVTWTIVNDRRVNGGAFDDTLVGNYRANIIEGRGGNDRLQGGAGDDTLRGGPGADYLDGGPGADLLDGGEGSDTYVVDHQSDMIVESGPGTDRVLARVSYVLPALAHVEVLRAYQVPTATPVSLVGNALPNIIRGHAGADRLNGKGGADKLYGYGGNDVYYVDDARDLVFESGVGIDTVVASTSYALASTASVEILRTNSAAGIKPIDLTGSSIANRIVGNAGANILSGKGGNDRLTGGAGEDTFVFNTALSAAGNVDLIRDFVPREDTIRLHATVFTALTPGLLRSGAFAGAAAARDAGDRILYDQETGLLSYDRDGIGEAAQIPFAVLATRPAIAHSDILIV